MKIISPKSIILSLGLFLIHVQFTTAQVTNCNTIACIQSAMATAQPGSEIVIASGTYQFTNEDKIPGSFGRNSYLYSGQDGTASNRIILRGADANNRPVIKGVDYNDGYLLGLEGNYWTIQDIEFQTGSKGVILDDADYTELINLEIHDVGEEALHFRHGTSDSTADNCFIHDTGRNPDKTDFGEGVYIGSDRSVHNLEYNGEGNEAYCAEWKRNQGRCGRFYNPSVNNITVINSRFGPNVTAEHFDVREGSCHVFIENNEFDAAGQILKDFQDSFIDLKGSYCYVRNNTFRQNGSTTTDRGVQVIDRDNNEGLILESAVNNVVSGNTFILDEGDTDSAILTFYQKRNGTDNYAYNNTRIPEGTIYRSGSDFIENEEPDFGNVECSEGDQFSEFNPDPVLSTQELFKNNTEVNLSPNPATNFIKINGLSNINKVIVYNMLGQTVDVSFDANTSEINVSSLASATYILQIETSNASTAKLFAVAR